MSSVIYFAIALTAFGIASAEVRTGESCVIENFHGQCMEPKDCPSFSIESTEEYIRFTRSNCGFAADLKTMIICCPETETRSKKPVLRPSRVGTKPSEASKAYCNKLGSRPTKHPRAEDNIHDGEPAKIDDFPQFASLAHSGEHGKFSIECGGVLISENFVLTAAHCLPRNKVVKFVRLGTIELHNKFWATDVAARRQILHPLYEPPSKYHDIALIELDESVLFTYYIWPACLYQGDDLSEETFDIAGFGKKDDDSFTMSTRLMKGNVTEVSTTECNRNYTAAFKGQSIPGYPEGINQSLICAKDLKKQANACKGDSGSGLHRKFSDTKDKRFVVGIVSAGVNCFTKLPSFYTKIFPYLDWIEGIVWPQTAE